MGLIERVVRVPPEYSGAYLGVSAGVTYRRGNRKAREQLLWKPRSLEEGLRATLLAEMRALGMR